MTRQQEGDEAAVMKFCEECGFPIETVRGKEVGTAWRHELPQGYTYFQFYEDHPECFNNPKLPATVQPDNRLEFAAIFDCNKCVNCSADKDDHSSEGENLYCVVEETPTVQPEDETTLPAMPKRPIATVGFPLMVKMDDVTLYANRIESLLSSITAERDALKAEIATYKKWLILKDCNVCRGSGEFVDSCEGGMMALCDCHATRSMELRKRAEKSESALRAVVGQETPQDAWERGVNHGLTIAVDEIEDEFDPSSQGLIVCIRENISDLRFKKYHYTPPLKAGQ